MSVIVCLGILGVLLLAWYKSCSKLLHELPPGPPADPLIGHLRHFSEENQGALFHSWAQYYGDVMYLQMLGRSFVILDSVIAATDLLDKRSSIYSDRPKFTFYEMLGFHPSLTTLPYGPRFRLHRKIVHSYFTRKACRPWQSFQTGLARQLAASLLEDGSEYTNLFSWFTTSISTKVAYGYDIKSKDDEYVQLAEHTSFAVNNSGPPGGSPVDLFPILRHLPSWFPGMFHVHFAKKWRWAIRGLHEVPFKKVQQELAEGKASPCLLTTELTKLHQMGSVNEKDLDELKGAAAIINAAGSETTWSSLTVFLLAMILFPETQKRAQEELDLIAGQDRLPDFSDHDSLPYMECLVQEVLRWHPVIPLGLPHRCMEDDIYKGMFIPKGSIVISNVCGMALDEKVYANPTVFNPCRFMPKPEGNGERFFTPAFGFGRRICPGRHLALASLWIAIATILATTKISKAIDEHGKEIEIVPEYTYGLASRPKYFPCKFESRSRRSRSLLPDQLE